MARTWTPSQETAMTLRGKTLLVSAAAGSGKTSVLTERIIRSLLDPNDPADLSRMLVVTFTRAAAAELKSRIAEALSSALAANPANTHLSSQLFLLGSAQISTIDAFFQKIVRANFETLGLPASFRIANESEVYPISMEILSGLLAEYYERYEKQEALKTPFDRILKNPFAVAMDHLMSNRSDGKLEKTLLEFFEEITSYPEGLLLLKQNAELLRKESKLDFLHTHYGKVLSEGLQEQITEQLQELALIREYLDTDPDIDAKLGAMVASDTDYCRALQAALSAQSYERVQAATNAFVNGRFPTIKPKPDEVARYHTWRGKLKAHQKKMAEYFGFSQEELTYQAERTADLCEVLYLFYSEYSERLMQEKKAHGILEFNDIRALLYRLLKDQSGNISELAKNLSEQYDAVYIDEYQDVDYVQDAIFSIIGGNRRFMVGDIKQSIYGFRGSEPSIFAGYRRKMPLHNEDGAQDADGNCVFMSENFRCDEPVIKFTNLICSFLFSACEKSIQYRPEDDLIKSKKDPDNIPADHPVPVCVSVFDKPQKASDDAENEDEEDASKEEAVWVAAEIARLLREGDLDCGDRIKPSDIAILIRSKTQLPPFQKALEELNIPVNLTTSSDILQDPLVIDLFNLLKAIDNPYRDLPLAEYLLSSLGGFTLEEITKIREAAPHSKALYDAMQVLVEHSDDEALTQKTADFLTWIERQRTQATAQPADKFLRLLYLEESIQPYSQEPALLFLYEQARLYQRTAWCGLYGFLQHFEKLSESGNASAGGFLQAEEAITVMTVHHSKGLEFPVVFLCACGAKFNKNDLKENLQYHKKLGLAAKLYSPQSGNFDDTLLRMAVKREIDAEQTEESIRTLYVALTRARERLYVTGTLAGRWDNAQANASTVQRGSRADILGCGNYLAWILAALAQKEANAENRYYELRHFALGEVEKGTPLGEILPTQCEDVTKAASLDPVVAHYEAILEANQSFVYPLSFLQGLPTKAAASRLQSNLLDVLCQEENENESLEAQIALMQKEPVGFESLLQSSSAVKATDIGTATHAFLEFCDFGRFYQSDIESECRALINADFLQASDADLIHKEQLSLFRDSDLMQWILQAKQIYREQKFGLHVPMSELTDDVLRKQQFTDHTLFVQGSIDLLLQTKDDRILLVDYKTDHISKQEQGDLQLLAKRMKERHGVQLSYYAKAVTELFGKAPDEIYIYSIPLGKPIKIVLDL